MGELLLDGMEDVKGGSWLKVCYEVFLRRATNNFYWNIPNIVASTRSKRRREEGKRDGNTEVLMALARRTQRSLS